MNGDFSSDFFRRRHRFLSEIVKAWWSPTRTTTGWAALLSSHNFHLLQLLTRIHQTFQHNTAQHNTTQYSKPPLITSWIFQQKCLGTSPALSNTTIRKEM
jgi:hypothetical protein